MTMNFRRETVVWITTEFEGYHKWPDAPEGRAYLGNMHRHIFKVKVTARVTHEDRQIEFHELKDRVNEVIANHLGWVKTPEGQCAWSCENMAVVIGAKLRTDDIDVETVSVSEDGECGAEIRVLYDRQS